jgi:multidrug efflux pump
LLLSQLLTLFTTPVIYLWMDSLARRVNGFFNLNSSDLESPENERSL